MEIKSIERVIFIELKGGDLAHALRQLFSAITLLKKEFGNFQIDARIVGSRDVPGFISLPDYLKLEKEIHFTKGKIERATNNIYLKIFEYGTLQHESHPKNLATKKCECQGRL